MRFDSIHNYYERPVIDEIMTTLVNGMGVQDEDLLEDIACVALNRLPARYVRHDVDMVFYLTTQERLEMDRAIADAVRFAWEFVNKRRQAAEEHRE